MNFKYYVSKRDWIITLTLAFFGGLIGLHRFYCGKIVTGVIYIFTGGFFGIGALVDLILIVCKKFKDKEGAIVLYSAIFDRRR